MLKLAFAGRLAYTRKEGFKTPDVSLPFKVLEGFGGGKIEMARPERFDLRAHFPAQGLTQGTVPGIRYVFGYVPGYSPTHEAIHIHSHSTWCEYISGTVPVVTLVQRAGGLLLAGLVLAFEDGAQFFCRDQILVASHCLLSLNERFD